MEETVLSFVAGLDTIGGNVVSIQHGNYRILTDFGAQVGASIPDQLDATLTTHLIETDRLPRLDGVYPHVSVQDIADLQAFEDSEVETIVCLSHLHIDHLGSLKHISPNIPVFALADAAPFYELLEETSLLPDYGIRIQGVEPEEELEFGPFNIVFHESDHDAIGAASIFIECPDLKIVYSGDFRLSGFHPDRVLTWAQKARDWQTDLLLIEGTSFSFSNTELTPEQIAIDNLIQEWELQTEEQAQKAFAKAFVDYVDSCIAFNGYPQNVERLVTFIQLAHKAGRQVLLQENMLSLIHPFIEGMENIAVYHSDKLEAIQSNPGHYAIQVDDQDLSWLEVDSKGLYLHSNGTPLGHYMPEYGEFVQWIVGAGWTFAQAGVSGHAYKEDLLTVAYLVNAQITLPWHTYNREGYHAALQDRGIASWMPQLGEQFTASQIVDLTQELP